MTRQEFIQWAKEKGYVSDPWGNYKKTITAKGHTVLIRYKINDTSVRAEQAYKNYDGKQEWKKKWSAYYKNLSVGEDGRLKINKLNG